ncbi:tRNA (adenosine(37)-N6)-dimethylallyltransferase MiaA [Treponema sp.]|uniref:tRNA (adenosine(37)-N6)-dimethylallyltransferase MiaA n=1 Tax=Treponema sp. TaxID=166 RepID=UPI0025CF3111|nr:tRNA (adenosine(37)-N6)-dimethylallyltransferase MiaA [Treponema sp.]
MSYNCIFVIGPTAVGKTAIGVRLADKFNGEIISADSRQVYKGLDIGSGKDLADYTLNGKAIPYHLIDVCDLNREYNLFDFQEDFYKAFKDITSRGKLPICVGGTGMYVDSILHEYDMIPFVEKPGEREVLATKTEEELKQILINEKEKLHNTSEFGDKERMIKSILINRFNISEECRIAREKLRASRPKLNPLVIGTTLDRTLVRSRIAKRLADRMEEGLIEEVENLHANKSENGAEWSRLEALGLEYRFVSDYLQGKYKSKEEMKELLQIAIGQFAKRQETWFRCMEKKGIKIHWLPQVMDIEERFQSACKIVETER